MTTREPVTSAIIGPSTSTITSDGDYLCGRIKAVAVKRCGFLPQPETYLPGYVPILQNGAEVSLRQGGGHEKVTFRRVELVIRGPWTPQWRGETAEVCRNSV